MTDHTVLIYDNQRIVICIACQKETIIGAGEYILLSIDDIITLKRREVKAKIRTPEGEIIEVTWPAYGKDHFTALTKVIEGKELGYKRSKEISDVIKKYI
jgi:hypothetical protein